MAASVLTSATPERADLMASPEIASLYLDLLKKSLTDWIGLDRPFNNMTLWDPAREGKDWKTNLITRLAQFLAPKEIYVMRDYTRGGTLEARRAKREEGRDWPAGAESMIGLKRLDNLQQCIETVLREGIPGDLIETGVFRGGATILMRGVLQAYGVTDRLVWVADSFEGLPPVTEADHALDKADPHDHFEFLKVSLETVQANFAKYGLLDDQVRFLKGWFKDTLPSAPITQLSILRLDGDMYASTMDAIRVLYPKLAPGGFCIVDDYGAVEGCKQAITDYRAAHQITAPIEVIDWGGVYWRVPQAS